LRWHREVGLLDRIHNRWESQRPECSAQIKVFVPIGLQEFYPALLVLYNGMLLSLTVLGVEFVYNSRAVTSCLLRAWRRENKEKEPLVADQ
ncbi:Ionotropic receptor 75a, partial [Frankliniella occidentalis]